MGNETFYGDGLTLYLCEWRISSLSNIFQNRDALVLINKEKCEALTDMRDDDSSVITKTDKENGVQIINKLDYLNIHLIPKWPQF